MRNKEMSICWESPIWLPTYNRQVTQSLWVPPRPLVEQGGIWPCGNPTQTTVRERRTLFNSSSQVSFLHCKAVMLLVLRSKPHSSGRNSWISSLTLVLVRTSNRTAYHAWTAEGAKHFGEQPEESSWELLTGTSLSFRCASPARTSYRSQVLPEDIHEEAPYSGRDPEESPDAK